MKKVELKQVSLGVVALSTVALHSVTLSASPYGEGDSYFTLDTSVLDGTDLLG